MLIVILQCLQALATVAFALVAHAVAQRLSDSRTPENHRRIWGLTAWGFGLLGLLSVAHNVWSTWAFIEGSESVVYERFMQILPASNYSRTLLMISFAGLLAAHPLLQRLTRPNYSAASGVALLAGTAAGFVVGVLEAPFRPEVHFAGTAFFDTVQMAATFAGLLVLLFTQAIDRILWLALALYALRNGLNSLVFAALSWTGASEAWSPTAVVIGSNFFFAIAVYLAMVALAVYRLRTPEPIVREGPVGSASPLPRW